MAAAPDVAAGDVLAAAYELAPALVPGAGGAAVAVRPAAGRGAALGRRRADRTDQVRCPREERCTAVLPAWPARSEHGLGRSQPRIRAAAHALAPGDPWQARQAAMAQDGRTGFEAAAVTGLAVALAMRAPGRGLLRTAELRFGHPYAVVAVPSESPGRAHGSGSGEQPWHGLPVFSAWVADPQDAGEA